MSLARTRAPDWRVVLDGQDLTSRIAPRLIDLELTEARGGEADELTLRIHDHDGRMALPKRGVTLSVAIGWKDAGLVDKGTFTVDEVEHSGSPDVITVKGRSAALATPMRMRKERSFHDTTLGAVVKAIAGDHGLQAKVDAKLSSITVKHLDQQGESDAALLTRLGKQHDAVATVKAGALIFAPIGKGQTAGGKPLPSAEISRADGDRHRYAAVDRESKFTGVRAYWNNKPGAKREAVLVGASDNEKRLQRTYASEQEAREAAQAEWGRVQRSAAALSYTLALGRPDLYPEQKVRVRGFKPEIDGASWLVAKVTHTITGSSGFMTALELETAI